MPTKRLGFPVIAGIAAVFLIAACGDSEPGPTATAVLSTPTPEPTAEATAVPQAILSQADVVKAVEKMLEEEGQDVTVADVLRSIQEGLLPGVGIDRDALEMMIEEELIPARAAPLAANRPAEGDEEDNETSTPDVLFRYMGAVNTLYAGQADEAIAEFDLIIRVHPDMARAYYYRGVAFYRAGFDEEAMADFDKAIELEPESGEPYLQRGLVNFRNGDRQAAMRDFNNAIDSAPWIGDAYRNRGALFLNNGVTGPGLNDLERALQIYEFERNRARVEEVRAILADPPDEPIRMVTTTDILPRLP